MKNIMHVFAGVYEFLKISYNMIVRIAAGAMALI